MDGSVLLLFFQEHYFRKSEVRSLEFFMKSVTNSLLQQSGGIKSIFVQETLTVQEVLSLLL